MKTRNISQILSRKTIATALVSMAICFVGAVVFQPLSASASEVDDLAKTIGNELRNAERLMFNGKKEESDQTLISAQSMLAELTAKDPGNTKLKTLESKYNKIRKDLDKRMGKTTKVSTPTALPPKPVAPAVSTSAPASAKAPQGRPRRINCPAV